jgi:hypothetical protein
LGFSHRGRAGLAAMNLDEQKYPIAAKLFGAVGVIVITQNRSRWDLKKDESELGRAGQVRKRQ